MDNSPNEQLADAGVTFMDMLATADHRLSEGDINAASQAVGDWCNAVDLLCRARQDLACDRLPLVRFRKTAAGIASRVLAEARKPGTIDRWRDAGVLYPIGDAIDCEAHGEAAAARGVVELIELDNQSGQSATATRPKEDPATTPAGDAEDKPTASAEVERAAMLYQQATEYDPALRTDKQVYDHLAETLEPEHLPPSLGAFQASLKRARKAGLLEPKRSPRHQGRATSKSVIRADQK